MKNKQFALITTFCTGILWMANVLAEPAKFNGTDYSGTYLCNGTNDKVGNYEVTVTLLLNKSNSRGNIGNYDLGVKTENAVAYTGQAVVKGNEMALTIKFMDGKKPIYSTGLAKFRRIYVEDGRYSYINDYYESENPGAGAKKAQDKDGDKGKDKEAEPKGTFGSEECVQKNLVVSQE